MRKTVIASAALIAALCCGAQTTKLTASKANDYGLIYSLPVTVVDITIETEHISQQPGEFSNYAKRHLGINDAIRTASETAAVKSITIVPRGVADADNRWLMQFKGGGTPYVILDAANLPVAINTDNVPVAVKPTLPEAVAAAPTPLETPAARQAVTQEMSQSSSKSKRAELAAQRIFELRETRNELISGQADNMPPDGKSLQLALENLTAQEAALTAMFAGTEKRWTEVSTVTFTPDSTDVKNKVIARLSATDGIVDADDLTGAPIYLSMQILSVGELPLDEKGLPRKFPKGGVAYNIPGSALITLSYDGRQLAQKELNLAQLGVTFGLDPKLFTDKKEPQFVLLDPTTGAITKLGSKAE